LVLLADGVPSDDVGAVRRERVVTRFAAASERCGHLCRGLVRCDMTARRLAGLALGAIAVLWGGILLIAAIERRLPDAQQWYGHVGVHLWTVAVTLTITLVGFGALRGDRVPTRSLRRLLGAVVMIASVWTVASALDAVGAYPTLRAFHDRVNAVAAPTGWVLLAGLILLVVVASTTELGARHREEGYGDVGAPS
jgi:hypothetical protein